VDKHEEGSDLGIMGFYALEIAQEMADTSFTEEN
jgi:hypothetical protein